MATTSSLQSRAPRIDRTSLYTLTVLVVALCGLPASAADFTITGPETTARTLGSGSGQTGTITATGVLTVGGATVAVTITGNDTTLSNLGTISQTGTGRVVRDNTCVARLVVNNRSATNASASMQAADGDVIQMNRPTASVTLDNHGQMLSSNASAGGSQAVDFSAITSGGNVVNNFATGLMKAFEADAVRPGVNGISTTRAGSFRSPPSAAATTASTCRTMPARRSRTT